jgi:hypothetical protein
MSKEIATFTYITAPQEIVLTYDDGSTEIFASEDAAEYIELTGRLADPEAIGWTDD